MPRRSRIPRVALIYDAKLPIDIKIMSGVAAYLQRSAPWDIYIEENALREQFLPKRGAWQGDGIIADLDAPRVAAMVASSGIPTVAFGSGYGWYDPASGIPYFFSDQCAVVRLVFNHFYSRGFRQFAYYGFHKGPVARFSEDRAAALADLVRAAGCRLWIHREPYEDYRKWESTQRRLSAWLKSLPKPIGLMAANDKPARQVLMACRAGGIRVPEDIAVVGVDNDEMLCQLSTPPLSSVEQGARRIGLKAAALLDRMMAGRKYRRTKFVIPPEGLVVRRSSDVIAVDDKDVAAALAMIQQQACRGIKVHDVAHAVAISRSQLDRRFKAAVGRTMHDEIRRIRLQEVQRLLVETSFPLKQIALHCGFCTVQYLTETFHQCVGVTPGTYRRKRAL